MSIINTVIPQQSFELVHNRIGAILYDEIRNQFQLSGNYDLQKVKIFKERFVNYNQAELPALNVFLERGEYNNQNPGHADGIYRYVIEGAMKAKAKGNAEGDNRGDTRSMVKLQRLLGICRSILEDPKYYTLAFAKPFIMSSHVENIYFGKTVEEDGSHVARGAITLVVRMPESNALIYPNLIKGYDTMVNLFLTDQGYLWSIDQPQGDTYDDSFDITFHVPFLIV
jgi:hypothetical protein